MLKQITGRVLSSTASSLVVDVHGIGFGVQTTPATLSALSEETATLYTHLVVREDSLTLYGFATGEERDAFTALQSVTGVGPRLAVALLAVHSPHDLAAAVAAGDKSSLERVPGVGPKMAARLLLELAGRLPEAATGSSRPSDGRDQVVEALVGLGWNSRESRQAVESVAPEAIPVADVSETLRRALVRLGGGHG